MVYSISKSSQCAFKDAIPFSEALEKTKYGKFNYFLIITTGIVFANTMLETTAVAMFMPVAHCDLELTNTRKGLLSAIAYVGIIISSHFWGFMADTRGRRRIIMPTLLLGFVTTLFSSFAINYWIMLALRFVNGILLTTIKTQTLAFWMHFTVYSIKKSNQFKGEQKSFENAIPFSEALEKTKFGKLNYFIIILSGIVMANVVLETASVAYFMPVANCDLNLTNSRKGILSAISYVGIIISAHLWGFLADTQGRKRIIMPTLLLGFVATLFSSFATNFWIMLILRFVNGIFISGSSATIYAYLGEFHIDRTRSRAIMISAFIFALGAMLLPFLSFLVINQDWRLPLPFLNITYKPWRLFVIVCGLPGCIAGLLLFFLPESPKFLLSIQKEDEAIEVLRKMYKMNGGKDELKEKTSKKYARKESTSRAYKNKTRAKISKPSGGLSLPMVYFHFPLEWYGMFAMARNLLHSVISPITHLLPEEDSNDISLIKDTNLNLFSKLFLTMWNQTVPLFRRKYIRSTAIVCVTQFWFHFITNGLYMWFPYIINAMSEFMNNNPGQNQLLCQIVYAKHANQTEGIMDCPDKLENATYLYSLIMEILYALSFVLIGLIVNYVGKKSILFTGTIFCSSCGLVAVWLPHTYTAAIFYVLLFLVGVCISVLGGATVELYPTQLRAMAMCISLMIGRIGSVVGTNIVGGFLATYCETTFYIACFSMMSCAIIIIFLPRSIHESSILKKSIDQES